MPANGRLNRAQRLPPSGRGLGAAVLESRWGGRGGRGLRPGVLTAGRVGGRVPCRELRREGRASQAPGSAQVCPPGPSPQLSPPPLPFSGLPWILWGKQKNRTAMCTDSLGLREQPEARDCGPDRVWVCMGRVGADTARLPGKGLRAGALAASGLGLGRSHLLALPGPVTCGRPQSHPSLPSGPQGPVLPPSHSLDF